MKVYKSAPNVYGWYCVIHKNNNGDLLISKKCINKKRKDCEKEFQIWGDDLELLKKVIKEDK